MKGGIHWLTVLAVSQTVATAGVELSGRLAVPASDPPVMLAAVRVFGFSTGHPRGSGFRTWEMEPRGWWKLEGEAGDWTVLFTGPAQFLRPCVLSAHLGEGEKRSRLAPRPWFDFACFAEAAWDSKPARAYWQPFVARSRSVTHVGFKLATDGVDGGGPGSQPVSVSIHRRTEGTPDSWPQIGPARVVPDVDCGGAKSYHFSVGWHSGEVPIELGGPYAVKLAPAKADGGIQAFWEPAREADACHRVSADGPAVATGHRLWMTVAGDGDGLMIPCNKRVHREFGAFAGYRTRWTQSWKAQGGSLCGVVLYTATSGTQPRMEEQRIAVRLRRAGPDGPVGPALGPEKIAAVSAHYTGDAAWGAIAAVYAPMEIPLTPGEVYTVEFATLETPESIGGFINFKGQPNDRKPGFNPYLRQPDDPYEDGEAWDQENHRIAGDLDLQVVEYDAGNR